MTLVYRQSDHFVVTTATDQPKRVDLEIDALFAAEDPADLLQTKLAAAKPTEIPSRPLAPLGTQDIWAAGVTYYRSMNARMEESKDAGGGTFYDRVYHADRPELFFKATARSVAGPEDQVRIRRDSKWNVPEPELTLAVNAHGRIFGYTIGNDMSSRDIEGENPLYLPQAKVYDRSAGLGPALLLSDEPLPATTEIAMEIARAGKAVFSGATTLDQIKRSLPSLVEYLYRENSFPCGCYLMTGTGIVPPDEFTLNSGDEIRISIEPMGTLINYVT